MSRGFDEKAGELQIVGAIGAIKSEKWHIDRLSDIDISHVNGVRDMHAQADQVVTSQLRGRYLFSLYTVTHFRLLIYLA